MFFIQVMRGHPGGRLLEVQGRKMGQKRKEGQGEGRQQRAWEAEVVSCNFVVQPYQTLN